MKGSSVLCDSDELSYLVLYPEYVVTSDLPIGPARLIADFCIAAAGSDLHTNALLARMPVRIKPNEGGYFDAILHPMWQVVRRSRLR